MFAGLVSCCVARGLDYYCSIYAHWIREFFYLQIFYVKYDLPGPLPTSPCWCHEVSAVLGIMGGRERYEKHLLAEHRVTYNRSVVK